MLWNPFFYLLLNFSKSSTFWGYTQTSILCAIYSKIIYILREFLLQLHISNHFHFSYNTVKFRVLKGQKFLVWLPRWNKKKILRSTILIFLTLSPILYDVSGSGHENGMTHICVDAKRICCNYILVDYPTGQIG